MIEKYMEIDEPLVRIENLGVRFGKQTVLRNINLSIPAGQTVALLGESGCGKTVLMKSIIGLVKPTQGRVFFDDEEIQKLDDRRLSRLRLRFGFVFQHSALFDSMTIGQNVAFPLMQHGNFEADQISDHERRDQRVDCTDSSPQSGHQSGRDPRHEHRQKDR